jgi:hypothetical protein
MKEEPYERTLAFEYKVAEFTMPPVFGALGVRPLTLANFLAFHAVDGFRLHSIVPVTTELYEVVFEREMEEGFV